MSRCELFYQLGLQAFSNFGSIRLVESVLIEEIVLVALEEEDLEGYGEEMMSKPEIARVLSFLVV